MFECILWNLPEHNGFVMAPIQISYISGNLSRLSFTYILIVIECSVQMFKLSVECCGGW